MAQLVPAILAHSKKGFKKKLKYLTPLFDFVQVDIMDGAFVNNTTYYNIEEIKKMNPTINLELHLMVQSPLSLIDDWKELEQVERIIFHKESVQTKEQIYDIITDIVERGKEVGLAINPETSTEEIEEFIPKINLLQVMGGHPGKSGQEFDSQMLKKIERVHSLYPDLHVGVDVGVSLITWKSMIDAGADTLASASMVFGLKSTEEIKKLKQEIENYT